MLLSCDSHVTSAGTFAIGDSGEATFKLQYKPQTCEQVRESQRGGGQRGGGQRGGLHDLPSSSCGMQSTSFVDMSYPFPVSNMQVLGAVTAAGGRCTVCSHLSVCPFPPQTVFHTQLFTEALKEHAAITCGEVAQLKYIIRNVAQSLTSPQLPRQLAYAISDPASDWELQGSPTGTVTTPKFNTSVLICILAVPKRSGTLGTPRLTLSVPRVGSKVTESEMVALTPAQVYELLLGETVTVAECQ